MNPSRILPDLQCSVVCEDVRQEINGNFILAGVVSLIRVPKLPVVAFRLFVFNRWTAGVGKFLEVVRLVGPDQATVLRKGQTQFALDNPAQNMTNVTLFSQVQLPAQGVYFIEVLVDDVMKLRYPLPVVLVQPQGQNAAGPATATAPDSTARPNAPAPADPPTPPPSAEGPPEEQPPHPS
jgi:hypothetical protein